MFHHTALEKPCRRNSFARNAKLNYIALCGLSVAAMRHVGTAVSMRQLSLGLKIGNRNLSISSLYQRTLAFQLFLHRY